MTTTGITFEHVVERVRAAQATYAQALDDGRPDDVADIFCVDGVTDIEGVGVFEGREAIRAAYSGWKPTRPQCHIVSNVLVSDWNEHQATATTDVVLLQLQETGWVMQIVARYTDVVRDDGDAWRFASRTTRITGVAPQ